VLFLEKRGGFKLTHFRSLWTGSVLSLSIFLLSSGNRRRPCVPSSGWSSMLAESFVTFPPPPATCPLPFGDAKKTVVTEREFCRRHAALFLNPPFFLTACCFRAKSLESGVPVPLLVCPSPLLLSKLPQLVVLFFPASQSGAVFSFRTQPRFVSFSLLFF